MYIYIYVICQFIISNNLYKQLMNLIGVILYNAVSDILKRVINLVLIKALHFKLYKFLKSLKILNYKIYYTIYMQVPEYQLTYF